MISIVETINGRIIVSPKYIEELKNIGGEVRVGSKGAYLNFKSVSGFKVFKTRYTVPENFIVTCEFHAVDTLFVHMESTSEQIEVSRFGMVQVQKGFLGHGVYCVSEKSFMNEQAEYNNMKNILKKHQITKQGHYSGITSSIFKYTGFLRATMMGNGMKGIFCLLTEEILEKDVSSVIKEEIEYIYE